MKTYERPAVQKANRRIVTNPTIVWIKFGPHELNLKITFLPVTIPSPGTPNNQFFMDGKGETTIFHVKIWNHPIETTIYKWLFGVPGRNVTFLAGIPDPYQPSFPTGTGRGHTQHIPIKQGRFLSVIGKLNPARWVFRQLIRKNDG